MDGCLPLLGPSWAVLGCYVGALGSGSGIKLAVLGPKLADAKLSGPILAILGRSWGLCWRSRATLGAYVGCLGAYVGGLGPFLGRMLAVLGCS